MKIKKTVALLMSALIVLSSLAVGTFTASASNYSVEQLETLCDTYEQKMDGSAHTNMLAAYEAWYNAEAYLVGVKAGMADAQDVDTYYTALESAINNMGTWTPATGNAQASFGNDTTGTSYDNYVDSSNGFDYTVNLLYSPTCSTYSVNSNNADVTLDMYYPTTVMLYDGINVPTMPIMVLASKGTGSARYIYQLYPSASSSDSSNNPNFRMTENWHAASHSGQQHNANWPWTMDAANVTGRPQAFAGASSTNDRVELYADTFWGIVTSRAIASLASGMQFVGAMDSNTYSAAYNLDWYRLTGDSASDSAFISNSAAPIYVINYKALLDAISSANLANITSYSHDGAVAILNAVQQCMNVDPNSYSYSSDTAGAVSSCASAIQNAVNAVNTAKASAGTIDIDSYMTLAGHYAEYADTYAAGQNNYTDASWNAFSSEYANAQGVLSAVVNKTAYMTATSSDALVNAYTALEENVNTDVTYTYHFANGSTQEVTVAAGETPVAPENSANSAATSNNDGTHTYYTYSWPAWVDGTTDYTEVATPVTEACDMQKTADAVAPTHTTTGKTQVDTCTVCGYQTGGEELATTPDHTWTEVSRTPATCVSEGKVEYTCECGATKTDVLDIDPSNHEGEKVSAGNAVVPTRGKDGYTGDMVCSACGVVLEKGTVIPALGVQITVDQNELGTTTLNSEATTGAAQKVAYKSNYTLVATPNEGAEFVGWQVNGKLVSTNATYTTAAYADLTYVPVFAEKTNEFTVTFVDQFNMVLGTYTSTEVASLEAMPSTYNYLGYTFANWNMTLEEVKALDTNAIVTANYTKNSSLTYTVSAPGCTITVGDAVYNDTAEVKFDQAVTVAPTAGTATAWTVNGNNAAYGAEYTFYVTADVNVAYTGDEVTAVPTVAAVDVTAVGDGSARFLATRNVPADYKLLESGFLYGKDYEDAEASLVLENANNGTCYIVKNSNTANDGQFALTFKIASQTGVAYARAYVIAEDTEGKAAVYYADVQSFNYDA